LGKSISFADLPLEYRSKLEIESLTTARSLARGKSRILDFIRSNNNNGENSRINENETDKGSVGISTDEGENDYENFLANARTEVVNIAERINRAAEFNEVLENDFQRLDELEERIWELISRQAEAEG